LTAARARALSVITLGVMIWSQKGFALNHAQLTLAGTLAAS
jgi:hypothetical protein